MLLVATESTLNAVLNRNLKVIYGAGSMNLLRGADLAVEAERSEDQIDQTSQLILDSRFSILGVGCCTSIPFWGLLDSTSYQSNSQCV